MSKSQKDERGKILFSDPDTQTRSDSSELQAEPREEKRTFLTGHWCWVIKYNVKEVKNRHFVVTWSKH